MHFLNIGLINKILDLRFKNYSHSRLAKSSVLLAVFTSAFLILIKLVAWLITNSISMQASMSDSCLDAISSFVAYHALRYSSVKFDHEHNYGHYKVEGIFAIFQCLVVMYSGYIICREVYESFINPSPIENSSVGIWVMVISCFAVYQLLYFEYYVGQKTGSLVVQVDFLHYISDFFLNICVMLSVFLSKYFVFVDVVCGLTIGIYVFYNAYTILLSALRDLMDESLPNDVQHKIKVTIEAVKGVRKLKSLRTRSAGMKKFIEAKVFVDAEISAQKAYEISQAAEKAVEQIFEDADVVVQTEVVAHEELH